MRAKPLGGCPEFRRAFPAMTANVSCCTSCHDDFDDGYGEPFETDKDESGGYYMVCCALLNTSTPDGG